jgi:3-hydroxyisobutyrate dehydrogenase-like beta-hydroxyacid dehydrogenase
MRISVLGLGRMGAPMARNLLEVGHEVTLYNRTRERATELAAAKGARVAATVAEAVREAQVALTVVSDDDAEDALTFDEGGLLANLAPGAIHLCMSTIGVETSRNLAWAHAEAGQGYVAAPVFGRPGAVASRHLWFVVGGPDAQVMRCLTVFDALGRGVTRVGPRAELAHALKLGGNLLSAVVVEGLAEVLAYGEKAGMASAEYLRLLNTAIFKSPMVDTIGGLMVRRAHDPADLRLDFALRDLQSTLQASEELDAVMPLAEFLHQRLEVASVQGWGAQDLTVLSRSCRLAAGLEALESEDASRNLQAESQRSTFKAQSSDGEVELDLDKITHFEIIKDAVWAWTQGKRYCTSWQHLAEVERAFGHVAFLRVHHHILLQPDAALADKPLVERTTQTLVEEKREQPLSSQKKPVFSDHVKDDKKPSTLDLSKVSHFEVEKDVAWAWIQGQRHQTQWHSLTEIESAFSQVILLRIQRNLLLHPEAVLSLSPAFGGRSKVKVTGNLELSVSRAATPRLKELLGL